MNRCFIFAALNTENLIIKPQANDLVIACDKGINNTDKLGITPNIIIGDFDSLGFVPDRENIKVLPIRKDDTDVGYAIKYALDLGYSDFVVYGAVGGSLDHTFANMQLAHYLCENGARGIFFGGNEAFTAIKNDSLRFKNARGRVSVFSLSEKSESVTLNGFDYPLQNATLFSSFPLGVGNSFLGDAEISVQNGTLAVIWSEKILPY